ncbi:MAG TPA: tetratricopeptide repeat protein, partial [Phycisphaerales bacterium]|nr:tetratricopeptide repeat protein [Phycisphaerales bacterium]
YRKACGAGVFMACVNVGYLLHEGLGTRRDPAAAARWYEYGANAGDPVAMFNLGLCLRDGDGVRANRAAARKWLLKASRLGHTRAREALERLRMR